MEQAPADYLVWLAVAILAGIAFKFAKAPLHFIVELIARFGNFVLYAVSSGKREHERRELRKQQHDHHDTKI